MAGEITLDVLIFAFTGLILLTGWLVKRHHSEFPDLFCGYHVGKIASQNKDTWEDANRWCGGLLLKSGLVFLLLDLAAIFLFHRLQTDRTLSVRYAPYCGNHDACIPRHLRDGAAVKA